MHSLKNCKANIHVNPIQVKKTNIVTTREAPCVPLHQNPPAGSTQHPTLHLIVMSSCFPRSVIVPHSLSFTTLIFLKSAGHLLCRMFLSLCPLTCASPSHSHHFTSTFLLWHHKMSQAHFLISLPQTGINHFSEEP